MHFSYKLPQAYVVIWLYRVLQQALRFYVLNLPVRQIFTRRA
jgi:hypothetical protein